MRMHVLSVFLLSTAIHAAQAQALPQDYVGALRQALANRPEIGVDTAGNAMATAKVGEAKAAFMPTLTAYSSIQHTSVYSGVSPTGVSVNYANQNLPVTFTDSLPPNGASTGLELRYNLYAGRADEARLDAAHAGQRAAAASAQITRKQVVEDVTRAYWAVVKAKLDARRIRRALDLAHAEAEAASVQARDGTLATIEADVKALSAQVLETEWRNSQRALADSIRNYLLALGTDSKPQYVEMLQQASPLEEVEHIGALDPNAVLAGFDLVGAAAVKKEIAEFDGATATIVQARADKRPRLDFLVGYNSGGRSAAGLDNAITHYKRDFSYVGLQLSWKLFDGFYTDSRIDYAVAKAEKQRWIIKQAQRDAEHAWQDKSSRVTELSEKVELAEKQLALSEAQRRIAEMRLATKRSSALQTRAAVNAVEDARDKVTGLKVDLFVARVEAMLARVN